MGPYFWGDALCNPNPFEGIKFGSWDCISRGVTTHQAPAHVHIEIHLINPYGVMAEIGSG
jgi:hypothetical protein